MQSVLGLQLMIMEEAPLGTGHHDPPPVGLVQLN